MRRSHVAFSLLVLLLTAACGQSLTQSQSIAFNGNVPPRAAVTNITDAASLADALRATGATVDVEGDVSQMFLHGIGVILRVDHQRLQVYEYADDQAARADAARFSPDGAWVSSDAGTTLVNWVATPHLYRTSKIIAVYIGDHDHTLSLLDDVLGAPFAGGANPYQSLIRTES